EHCGQHEYNPEEQTSSHSTSRKRKHHHRPIEEEIEIAMVFRFSKVIQRKDKNEGTEANPYEPRYLNKHSCPWLKKCPSSKEGKGALTFYTVVDSSLKYHSPTLGNLFQEDQGRTEGVAVETGSSSSSQDIDCLAPPARTVLVQTDLLKVLQGL